MAGFTSNGLSLAPALRTKRREKLETVHLHFGSPEPDIPTNPKDFDTKDSVLTV